MELIRSGKKIVLYDSIKEIPAARLLSFQVQLTQHNSMGSTFEQLDASLARMDAFLAAGRAQDAWKERQNMRLGFWLMFNDTNTMSLTLANLVKEIDGVPVSVRTDDDVVRVAKILEGTELTVGEMDELIDSLKKKSQQD